MLWEKVMFQSLSTTENLTSIGENISWALPGKLSGDVRKIKSTFIGCMYYYIEKPRSFSFGLVKNEMNCLTGWYSLREVVTGANQVKCWYLYFFEFFRHDFLSWRNKCFLVALWCNGTWHGVLQVWRSPLLSMKSSVAPSPTMWLSN